MADWKRTLLSPDSVIADAIKVIDDSALQICLVVDDTERLLGTVTDGDIRRALLRGLGLEVPIDAIMKRDPLTAKPKTGREKLLAIMADSMLRQIPLLDADGRVVGLALIDELIRPACGRRNPVVLMAGGIGSRLMPLTKSAPKPLLSVGDKPLLETILETFVEQNFRRFFISVNYKAHMIRDHFGDGRKWDADIRYLEEDRPLGTAGALRLIPERPDEPMIVMNGDLLTRVNFQHLLDYHRQSAAKATMCVREYDFEVPFGVVEIEDNRIRSLDEKPVHSFFVNAGIYVLDSEVVDLIPAGETCDMTTLFESLIGEGLPAAAFPIREYWLDVGSADQLKQANWEFETLFEDEKP